VISRIIRVIRHGLIERMFNRLKDRHRIATRYDRCGHTFTSPICIPATVVVWLFILSLREKQKKDAIGGKV